ncbi:hypothetical protein, partial [Sphaerochaeta sp.]|uniref:hypothetical protein n=1 Tax=Sphaerochaeta sp. TaxID=1972642 RepID=UPI003D11D16B
ASQYYWEIVLPSTVLVLSTMRVSISYRPPEKYTIRGWKRIQEVKNGLAPGQPANDPTTVA